MKKVSALAFSILFLAFTIEPFIGIAEAAPEVVLDTSSHKLRIGVKYYILSVFKGKGGGLTISSSDNNTCSFFVVQEKLEVSKAPSYLHTLQCQKWCHTNLNRSQHQVLSLRAFVTKWSQV